SPTTALPQPCQQRSLVAIYEEKKGQKTAIITALQPSWTHLDQIVWRFVRRHFSDVFHLKSKPRCANKHISNNSMLMLALMSPRRPSLSQLYWDSHSSTCWCRESWGYRHC